MVLRFKKKYVTIFFPDFEWGLVVLVLIICSFIANFLQEIDFLMLKNCEKLKKKISAHHQPI